MLDALITGYYCDAHGQTAITAECAAGHYCTLGANTSTPTDGSTGNPKKSHLYLLYKLLSLLQKDCLIDIQPHLLCYFFLQGTFAQKAITVSKGQANQSRVEMEHT